MWFIIIERLKKSKIHVNKKKWNFILLNIFILQYKIYIYLLKTDFNNKIFLYI